MNWKDVDRETARRSESAAEGSGVVRTSSLKDALVEAVFGNHRPAPDAQALAACSVHWAAIAGDLSEASRPVRVSGGRLLIECTHAVFAQELQLQTLVLLARVQRHSSAIRSLQIRTRVTENYSSV